jgi:hypothetical protein
MALNPGSRKLEHVRWFVSSSKTGVVCSGDFGWFAAILARWLVGGSIREWVMMMMIRFRFRVVEDWVCGWMT